MPEPLSFTSVSPRHSLPFLFVGQAQKEFHVNEAHARIDALLHPAVEGITESPPAAPVEGECWLAGATPTGAWAGYPGHLACFEAGAWLLAAPIEGMRVFDKGAGIARLRREDAWVGAESVALPTGGTTVDVEARAAIAALVAALQSGGIMPPP